MDEVTRGARALVLCPDVRTLTYDLDAAERLAEADGLALAIGVGAHLVQLGNIILFGVLGHLAMASFSNPKER